MRRGVTRISPVVWIAVVALVLGFALGRGWPSGGITAAMRSQATPAAECLPSSTATPVASASPAAVGQPVTYGADWTVTVKGIATTPTIGRFQPEGGLYAVVFLTITNNTGAVGYFPFDELVLLDDQERPFLADTFMTNLHEASAGLYFPFQPSLPTETAVVFDVVPDVGTTFILQSNTDPTFRVRIELEMRGALDRRTW